MISLKLSLAFYLCLVLIVLYMKPSFIFDDKGHIKQFGTGGGSKTLLPLWLIFLLFAVISYNMVRMLNISD